MARQFVVLIVICTFVHCKDINKGREYVPYMVSEIELLNERRTYNDFRYKTANTEVPMDWIDIPEDKKAILPEAHGIRDCNPHFKVKFPYYKNNKRTVCLYKDTSWYPHNGTVVVSGKIVTQKDFMHETHPVKGFVVNEMNSFVKGYIIDGNFYGTIRIFDSLSAYHLHFYIEPIKNLDLYTKQTLVVNSHRGGTVDNALVFEYVGHGVHEEEIPPDEAAKLIYEKIRNATGGPVLVEVGRTGMNNDLKMMPVQDEEPKHKTTDPPNEEHLNAAQKHKEASRQEMGAIPEEILLRYHNDLVGAVDLKGGVSTSDIFDTARASTSSYLCPLCVWIQPLFAEKFGFRKGQIYAAGEVIEMIKRMDWIFRAMDFNVDSVAENLGFRIKSIVVSDQIHVATQDENNKSTKSKPDEGRRRRGRRNVENNQDNNQTTSSKRLYKDILHQIHGLAEFKDCCAMIALIYHDITPMLSLATLRGLCSNQNLVVVSGNFFEHKVGIYDIQRAVFHGVSHLMGATHDKTLKARCQDRKPAKFYNPFLMHPVQQTNVGLRTNSYKLSFCSKLEVTDFLDANNLNECLVNDKDNFCGNGMVDPGEDCDCGSPWQCHLQECCGESDTLFGCKVNKLGVQVTCERPFHW